METSCNATTTGSAAFFTSCGLYRAVPNVQLYPNPARDQVTIKLNEISGQIISTKLQDIREVKIVDKLGNIRSILKYPSNTKIINLNVSNLPSDIYFIEVSDGRNKARLSLGKQK